MSAQGIKSRIQEIHLTGDKWDGTQQEARRMPPQHCRGNVAWAAFPRQYGRARARALGQGLPLAPFPLVPINTPRGLQLGDIQRIELYLLLCC